MSKTKYFLYAIIIIGYILMAQYILNVLQRNAAVTFQPKLYIISGYIIFLILGVILGLEHIVDNWKKEGLWKFNYMKLLIVGLPVLVLSLYTPLYFWCYQWFKLPVLSVNLDFTPITTLIFGFLIATSFYKKNSST